MALALDTASAFPLTAKHNVADGSFNTISISGVTTSANAMVVVVISANGTNNSFMFQGGLTISTNTGVTWTNDEAQNSTSGYQANQMGSWVWHGYSAAGLSNQTITITYNGAAGTGAALMAVYSFTGASSTIGNLDGAVDSAGISIPVACTINMSAGSMGVCGSFTDSNAAPAALANSTKDISTTESGGDFGGYAIFHLTSPTSGAGNVTFGKSQADQPDSARAGVEILASTGLDAGTAFQCNAFQDSAFQILGNAVSTAFQPDAFQDSAFQVYGGRVGLTYNESESESALAQDVLLTAQGFAQPDSYSALAQDVLLTAVGLNASQSESALAQDVLLTAQGFASSLSQSALAQETLATAEGLNASEAESALAQDQSATAEAMLAVLSESALAQDTALPAMQMPVGLLEGGLADVLFDSTLLHPGTGTQYDESLIESCLAQEALATALGNGSGVEAKIGGAGAGVSIFIFDD